MTLRYFSCDVPDYLVMTQGFITAYAYTNIREPIELKFTELPAPATLSREAVWATVDKFVLEYNGKLNGRGEPEWRMRNPNGLIDAICSLAVPPVKNVPVMTKIDVDDIWEREIAFKVNYIIDTLIRAGIAREK